MTKYDEYDIRNIKSVGETRYDKLASIGISNAFDILIRGSTDLAESLGSTIGESVLNKIVWEAYEKVVDSGICRPSNMSVRELRDWRKSLTPLKTYCTDFDNLLGGGFERETLIEIYGENGVGKTQTCFTLAVEAIEQWDTDVVWIDIEDTLEPDRLIQIMIGRGYAQNEEEALDKLDRITLRTCSNTDILMMEMNKLTDLLIEKKPKLIILDGVTGQFRAEYRGRGTLSGRQQNLNLFLHILKNICFFFGCTIVYTNQVQSDPGAPAFMNPIKPIGGNVVGHVSKRRIWLQKRGSKRVARLEKSSKDAIEECYYDVTEKGIVDAPSTKRK